jgi:hypothetical protein
MTWRLGSTSRTQRKAILRGNFIVGHCAIRRDLYLSVGGFDPAVYTADWDCWIRLILGGARVGLVNEPLALYRVWAGSLSSSRLPYALGHVQTLEKTAARDDLDESERAVLQESLERRRRTAELTAAEAALADRSPGARRRLLRIALDRRYEGRTRAKAAAAALAARAARRRLRRRTEAGESRLGRPATGRRPARASTACAGSLPPRVPITPCSQCASSRGRKPMSSESARKTTPPARSPTITPAAPPSASTSPYATAPPAAAISTTRTSPPSSQRIGPVRRAA